jgi:glucosamine-phosphate N-acetyltransferase
MNNKNENEFIFRDLEEGDYEKGYFELLSQLTIAPKPNLSDWVLRYKEIMAYPDLYKIIIIESREKNIVVGTITIVTELKFIRNLGKIGHIEDFVIDKEFRNRKLGAQLIQRAKEYCQETGCYKVILDSKDEVKGFYEKTGFRINGHNMVVYFDK